MASFIDTDIKVFQKVVKAGDAFVFPKDVKVLQGLVKRWLQDLKDDMEEPLQARFVFKSNLVDSMNQITCSFCQSD
ncbi:hypothetical protein Dsin_018443 [Dipteronia sinensis]|uniref:Uncharacterized protein n=1 Tax=Dipteronia sinensis TaxID=43782 RepID=A0AAE0A5W9_9ROSI|nr:hypothetical protein Dsin_018443 [Dipteronia sinensis]